MIRPAPLRHGDVVRVVAPSGPFDAAAFEQGLAILRDRFRLVPRLRDDVLARQGYLAGDDARRAEEWAEAAADPEARAIWCARGGYGAMRILPRIDPVRLLHPPKWVIGFSDVTAIHAALNGAGLATVHGPMIAFLPRTPPAALDHLEALLFGHARRPASGEAPGPGAGVVGTGVIRPGVASGPLLGGSLTLLSHLVGTRYLPRLSGAVLFLEDVGEEPYKLDRYLTHLRLAGALEGIRAVCVGQLSGSDRNGVTAIETVRGIVRALGVPAIEGLPCGHEPDNHALLLGSIAHVVAPGPGDASPPRVVFEPGTGVGA